MLNIIDNRRMLAQQLRGNGIEFGALDAPTPLSEDTVIKYSDHRTTDELRTRYPDRPTMPIDFVIEDSELSCIEDGKYDFLIANQVIEHLPDPIGGIKTWAKKLVPGGSLFLGWPIHEYCPDKVHPLTSLSHLEKDHEIKRSNATAEDLLSFSWAWNPEQFPAPDIIEKILQDLWKSDAEELSDDHLKMLGKNKKIVEKILADRSEELHFHTFDIETIIKIAELAGLYPHDVALGKGLLSENIIVFKLGIPTPTHFYARLSAEKWVDTFVKEQAEFIQFQRKILDERLDIINSLQAK